MTALPTRRSLREAERRAAASEPTPVTDAPTPATHVPSWAHHGPVTAPPTEAFAAPARRAQDPAAPSPRAAWSAGPQGRPAASVGAALHPVAAAPVAAPQRRPDPAVSTPQPRPAAAVSTPQPRPAAAVSTPQPRPAPAVSNPLPVLPARIAAPTAATAVIAPVEPEPAIAPVPVGVDEAVQEAPELVLVEHGTVRRRTRRPTRAAARLSVLGVLAGITVVVPVSQGLVPGPVAFGSDALADSTLPSTVSALAGASALSAAPPTSLASSDGALQARGLATASRTEERSALPGCDGSVRAAGQNGLLKTADLCTLWDNHTQLRADAAVSLAEFNQAFAARFGGDLCLSSGYRTLASQRAVKAQKGGLAAAPGKSNHGWGLAIDLCQDQTSGVKWRWITENGPTYGWVNPAWAQPGGSGPYERWHWEFEKGVQDDGEYYDG